METSEKLIAELRRVACDLTRDTCLYSVAELLKAAANMLAENDEIIEHLYETNQNYLKSIELIGESKK